MTRLLGKIEETDQKVEALGLISEKEGIERKVSVHMSSTRKIIEKARTIAIAILNGIPIELAFTISPSKKREVLGKYFKETKDIKYSRINLAT